MRRREVREPPAQEFSRAKDERRSHLTRGAAILVNRNVNLCRTSGRFQAGESLRRSTELRPRDVHRNHGRRAQGLHGTRGGQAALREFSDPSPAVPALARAWLRGLVKVLLRGLRWRQPPAVTTRRSKLPKKVSLRLSYGIHRSEILLVLEHRHADADC